MDIHREAYLCCVACLQRFNVPASILISSEQFVAHLSFLSTTLTDHPRQWLKKTSIFILVFGHVSPLHDCLRSIRPKYNSLVESLAALMAVNVVTNGTGSTMLVPALRCFA